MLAHIPCMAKISVRVADDLAARFDQAARLAGGRAVVLRRLMASLAVPVAWREADLTATTAARICVRLSALETAKLDAEAAVLPPDYTFAPADNGEQTFTVAMKNAGTERIRVADVDNDLITGLATVNVV